MSASADIVKTSGGFGTEPKVDLTFVYLANQKVRGEKWRAAARAQRTSSAEGLPKEVDVTNRAHEFLFEPTTLHDDATLAS